MKNFLKRRKFIFPHIAIIVLVGSVAGGTASNVVSYLA